MTLTSVDILIDTAFDAALVLLSCALDLEDAVAAVLEHAVGVHGALERVAFPSEDVVGVGSVALAVVVTPDEWV